MKEKEILQFEEDDTSELGMNGKQVFFTKRINGQTTRNKAVNEDDNTFNNKKNIKQKEEDEDLFIEFKTPYNPEIQKQEKIDQKNAKKEQKLRERERRKQEQIRKKKKISKKARKRKRIIKLILLLLILIGITVFAMISPIFNIQNVKVEGNEKLTSQKIISLSGIKEGENIFRINKKNIIKKVKEDSYVESVNISRKIPNTININIEERKVAYQIKVIDGYTYIDYQGYILETTSSKENVPLLEGLKVTQDELLNQKRLQNEDIKALRKILKIMDTAKSSDISKLITKIIVENDEYVLELESENKVVYLGDATDMTNKILYLKVILENEKNKKGKIFINGNLNNGFKPYFREEEEKEKVENNE